MNNVKRTHLFHLLSAFLGVYALAGCAISGVDPVADTDVTAGKSFEVIERLKV